MVLTGRKTELRKDAERLHKFQEAQLEPGTCTQSQHAPYYLECSAVLGERGGHLRGRQDCPEHSAEGTEAEQSCAQTVPPIQHPPQVSKGTWSRASPGPRVWGPGSGS